MLDVFDDSSFTSQAKWQAGCSKSLKNNTSTKALEPDFYNMEYRIEIEKERKNITN
jgi:hypothetical protein